MADEFPDMSDQYNTPLGNNQPAYDQWTKDQSAAVGRNVGNDKYDYDLQGWWKENGSQDLSDAHLTDKYKKPNHPTFSDQSVYHGVDGYQGGTWQSKPGLDQYTFTPGPTNLLSIPQLMDYFQRVEPQNELQVPMS